MKRQHFLSKSIWLALVVLISFWFHIIAWGQESRSNKDSSVEDKQADLVVQLGHASGTVAITISADGQYVVTGGSDNLARLWETRTGKEIRKFAGHTDTVSAVAISADGNYVATCGLDNTVRLWETSTGREVRKLKHSSYLYSISGDGKYAVLGSDAKKAWLWDTAADKVMEAFAVESAEIKSAAISVDGQYVVTGSNDKTVRLWERKSGKEIEKFKGHTGPVSAVAFSANGKYLVTASKDKTARLWEFNTGKQVQVFFVQTEYLGTVAVSDDGEYVITHSGDSSVHIWVTRTGKELPQFNDMPCMVTSASISADGKHLAICMENIFASWLWEIATGKEKQVFETKTSDCGTVAISADGRYVVAGSGQPGMRLWEIATGKVVRTFRGHKAFVRSVAITPDGKYVVAGGLDKTARLFETESGKELRRFEGHSDEVWSVAISADGKYVVTGTRGQIARVWDTKSGKEIRKLESSDLIMSVAFSADGKYIVTGSSRNTAQLWDAKTGKEVRRFGERSRTSLINTLSVAISADGKYVVTCDDDGTAKWWDIESGKEIRKSEGPSDAVYSIAVSADGKYVLTGSRDTKARLREVKTGKVVRTFQGHSGVVSSVAFSPDGKYVATSSWDNTVRLWDISSGKEMCSLVSFLDGNWAAIDPDGRYDASNGGDIDGMHWAVGNEIIELSQLKHRYYEPGLLASILKQGDLRDVSAFRNVKLFPDVKYESPAPGSTLLKIKLTNRGGGIGPVAVFVNGKEVKADARGPRPNPRADKAELTVDLANTAFKPGENNSIRVLAYNAEGWLSSRGPEVVWAAPGEAEKAPPELYAIVGGVSTYSAESVNLRYAAKDAEDMAKALRIGAKNLFGADKTHITVLSTSGNPGTIRPTKENFRKAFESVRKAKPGDVLIVYLAGHGLALRLTRDNDTYCYLTEEWRGSTNLSDEAVRQEQSLTSDDLVEWLRQVRADKQIMMLDMRGRSGG